MLQATFTFETVPTISSAQTVVAYIRKRKEPLLQENKPQDAPVLREKTQGTGGRIIVQLLTGKLVGHLPMKSALPGLEGTAHSSQLPKSVARPHWRMLFPLPHFSPCPPVVSLQD